MMDKVRSLYENFLRSQPDIRTPERDGACHTASTCMLTEKEPETALCGTGHTSSMSMCPIAEEDKTHEEVASNMDERADTSEIAEDLILKVPCPLADYFDELAHRAREKTRLNGGFGREWLIEQIMELSGGDRKHAEAVFNVLVRDGYTMEKPGGDYIWTV